MADSTQRCEASSKRRGRCAAALAALLVVVVGCSDGKPSATVVGGPSPAPSEPPRDALGEVLCLSTETYPAGAVFQDLLLREIMRQGVLIAAREELGMLTRDATLGEPFPALEGTARRESPLALSARFDLGSGWEATLRVQDTPQTLPLWEGKGTLSSDVRTRYPQVVAAVTEASEAIAQRLEAAGASDASLPLTTENDPPPEVETLLGEMNFVSQYTVVRAAHRAIREEGPSLAWLDTLVRSYAHLSALTEHTWSSHSDAFAARSLLYAERLARLDQGGTRGRWSRAYAYAVLGLHALALDEVQELRGLDAPAGHDPPAYAALVAAVASYDHDEVQAVGAAHAELAETAAMLQWRLYFSYLHGRWIYEKGVEAMRACPEAYGVYSVMANWQALGIKRVGVNAGVAAFGDRLTRRVARVDHPESVGPLVVSNDWIKQALGLSASSALGDRPMKVARALLDESSGAVEDEFSWAVLGQLIAEEQFVQAANLLKVSQDAVEHSDKSLVESLRPLVEGRRYAPYIESYTHARAESDAIAHELSKLVVVDPRGVMEPMFRRAWAQPISGRPCGYDHGMAAVEQRSRTVPHLVQALHYIVLRWTNNFSEADNVRLMQDFAVVSPHSPHARRHKFSRGNSPGPEVLRELEKSINGDPLSWIAAALCYKRVDDVDNAIRCYRRSLEISPSLKATESLAAIYDGLGDKEKWEETLASYLEVEELSLTHAHIHRKLADVRIAERAWKRAEPHAVEAAQTYSSWGLTLASQVFEGMQDWEKSERFAAAASRSYPSGYTGTQWYFWCHRTGRGDLTNARAIAAKSIAVAERRSAYDSLLRVALFRWLEGDPEAALAHIEGPLQRCRDSSEPWTHAYNLMLAASVAAELDDAEALQRSVAGVRVLLTSDAIQAYPDWIVFFEGMCDAFNGKSPEEGFFETADRALRQTSVTYRCDYSYFFGAALDRLDKTALADEYYGIAAFAAPFQRYSGVLAGKRLVERHGPGRGGLPDEYAEIEAKAKAAGESAADAAEEGDEAGDSDDEAAAPDAEPPVEEAEDQA